MNEARREPSVGVAPRALIAVAFFGISQFFADVTVWHLSGPFRGSAGAGVVWVASSLLAAAAVFLITAQRPIRGLLLALLWLAVPSVLWGEKHAPSAASIMGWGRSRAVYPTPASCREGLRMPLTPDRCIGETLSSRGASGGYVVVLVGERCDATPEVFSAYFGRASSVHAYEDYPCPARVALPLAPPAAPLELRPRECRRFADPERSIVTRYRLQLEEGCALVHTNNVALDRLAECSGGLDACPTRGPT